MNRIGIGNLTAAILILVIFAGNLFSFRNFHFESEFSKSRGLRELARMLDSWGAGLNKTDVRFAQTFLDLALWDYYYTGEIEHVTLSLWPMDLEVPREPSEISAVGVSKQSFCWFDRIWILRRPNWICKSGQSDGAGKLTEWDCGNNQ